MHLLSYSVFLFFFNHIFLAYDSLNNSNILKLGNFLLFGFSSIVELEDKALPYDFNETFLIISANKIFIFSSNSRKEFFYNLCSKINNIEIEYYFPTKKEECDTEKVQILKISKFIEQTRNYKTIGVTLLNKEKNNITEIEKWPLINAVGLDILKEGFFTMKHDIIDLSLEFDNLYTKYDISAIFNFLINKANKLETILSDFFNMFDREIIENRLNKSEDNFNDNQELDFLLLNYQNLKKTRFNYLNNLPDTRVLIGYNTDKQFDEKTSSDSIYKSNILFLF